MRDDVSAGTASCRIGHERLGDETFSTPRDNVLGRDRVEALATKPPPRSHQGVGFSRESRLVDWPSRAPGASQSHQPPRDGFVPAALGHREEINSRVTTLRPTRLLPARPRGSLKPGPVDQASRAPSSAAALYAGIASVSLRTPSGPISGRVRHDPEDSPNQAGSQRFILHDPAASDHPDADPHPLRGLAHADAFR